MHIRHTATTANIFLRFGITFSDKYGIQSTEFVFIVLNLSLISSLGSKLTNQIPKEISRTSKLVIEVYVHLTIGCF